MKIYVVAEYTSTSGGPESLHQLVDVLSCNGYDTYIYYIDSKIAKVPDKFSKYNINIAMSIDDHKENVIIVPESYTEVLHKFKNIKKVIWWLSLDFYLNNLWVNRIKIFCKAHNVPLLFFPIVFLYLLFSRKLKWNLYKYKNCKDVFHFYNCELVNQYLTKIGVQDNMKKYLCGPLRDEYFDNDLNQKRENIVLYNPKKGLQFTNLLISKMDDDNIQFYPIQDMTPSEIRDIMLRSKVYIDFGYFPGPERIPREAVMMGLNIITSLSGSAKNSTDVPIPNEFKFQISNENIDLINKLIKKMNYQYEEYTHYFDEYRNTVIKQKKNFTNNIIDSIKIIEDM